MIVKEPKFEISAVGPKQYPSTNLPEVVLVGKSNVGKSSFINTLINRKKLAKTSSEPGKTRQINFYNIDSKFYFVDLPGYGFAKAAEQTRQTWSELIGGYLANRGNLTGIVIVMDARRPFMPNDQWVIDFLNSRPVKLHFLLNKADQLNNQAKKDVLRQATAVAKQLGPHVTVQLFSGLKRQGVDELRETLLKWIHREEILESA